MPLLEIAPMQAAVVDGLRLSQENGLICQRIFQPRLAAAQLSMLAVPLQLYITK